MDDSPIYDGCFIGDGEEKASNWKLGRKIARGVNTHVLEVIDINKLHVQKCVVKQAFMSDDTDMKFLKAIEVEMKALRKVKHQRILEYVGYSRNNKVFSLFLLYMEMGSLASYIKCQDEGHLTEEKTASFTSQILEGLEYLHKERIIHRDIKASNVLMKNDFEVKISDFGVAEILNTLSKVHTHGAGTRNWMAPEMFQDVPHDCKVDIWSLGCTVFQMVTGNIPFSELTETQIILKGHLNQLDLSVPEHLSPKLKHFLRQSCTRDPAERPNAAELSHHQFITENSRKQFYTGGTIKLHSHYIGCKKNPGHVTFIPVDDFNLDYLPPRYRDVIMLEVIKALSALTVLIKVKYTSLERPKSVPCFSGQYPFYNTRGSDVFRTGTGRVRHVDKYTESDNKGTCPCGKCQHSDTPSKVWGEVGVMTAAHVVFDESEARQTKCVVGFDDNKSPGVSLDGWGVEWADIEGDRCQFTCVSCDLELVDKLDKMCRRFDDLCEKVGDKYERFDDMDKLTVIVSHPHGCPKQVSVGQWTHKHERGVWSKYTYTTCTCPGSSGAQVYMPGYVVWWHRPHSGSNSEGNYSGENRWLLY